MTDTIISPLRRRMIEDMTVRGFTSATQRGYLRAVTDFTAFFGDAPDGASAGELRRYQLHLRSSETSATNMNAAVSALRFFFTVTPGRRQTAAWMTTVREPRKPPVILSPQEVARLLDAAPGLQVPGRSERGLQRRPARLSEGQMSDYKGAALMVDTLPKAKAMLGDKGYDADWFRDALVARGITACIPSKANRKKPIAHDRALYRQRHKIENMFGKLKDWRRIHTRYDRCAHSFFSAICIAAAVIFWL